MLSVDDIYPLHFNYQTFIFRTLQILRDVSVYHCYSTDQEWLISRGTDECLPRLEYDYSQTHDTPVTLTG